MKSTLFALLLAAGAVAATAQTPAPAPATAVHHAAAASTALNLPPGVPRVPGIVKTAFSLRYEDIKIGTGPLVEPNKMYKVQYTGYLGRNGRPDDGRKFDSSYDHRGPPVRGADGKPEMDADGKPKMGDPQPMSFPQGMGRLIPGFDQGFAGMKIGGKRRIFIPWQLAYGARGRPGPDEAHPGIPPKADLIFDVELVDATDLPMPPSHPGMGGRPMPGGMPHPGAPGTPGTPGAPPNPGAPPAPGTTPAPGSAPAPGAAPAPAPGATPTPTTTVPVPVTPPPATPATPPTPPTSTTPQTH
jgi:peptidylprolyl isomerase